MDKSNNSDKDPGSEGKSPAAHSNRKVTRERKKKKKQGRNVNPTLKTKKQLNSGVLDSAPFGRKGKDTPISARRMKKMRKHNESLESSEKRDREVKNKRKAAQHKRGKKPKTTSFVQNKNPGKKVGLWVKKTPGLDWSLLYSQWTIILKEATFSNNQISEFTNALSVFCGDNCTPTQRRLYIVSTGLVSEQEFNQGTPFAQKIMRWMVALNKPGAASAPVLNTAFDPIDTPSHDDSSDSGYGGDNSSKSRNRILDSAGDSYSDSEESDSSSSSDEETDEERPTRPTDKLDTMWLENWNNWIVDECTLHSCPSTVLHDDLRPDLLTNNEMSHPDAKYALIAYTRRPMFKIFGYRTPIPIYSWWKGVRTIRRASIELASQVLTSNVANIYLARETLESKITNAVSAASAVNLDRYLILENEPEFIQQDTIHLCLDLANKMKYESRERDFPKSPGTQGKLSTAIELMKSSYLTYQTLKTILKYAVLVYLVGRYSAHSPVFRWGVKTQLQLIRTVILEIITPLWTVFSTVSDAGHLSRAVLGSGALGDLSLSGWEKTLAPYLQTLHAIWSLG